jgi:hypothetical protein
MKKGINLDALLERINFDALKGPVESSTLELERSVSRRDAFAGLGAWGKGLAIASVPVALAALAKGATAQSGGRLPPNVEAVLNFALLLEFLEAEFYVRGVESVPFPNNRTRDVFRIIRDHEVTHVQFLQGALGSQAISKPNFDFTAGGMFANVFSNYQTFATLAQGFEDTGVRAYKGQAGRLMPFDFYLTAALTIHSVEARHASKVRRLRASPAEEGWIPFDQPGAGPLAAVYAGEGQTTQLGIDLTTLSYNAEGITAEAITEAFDEPLSAREVFAIVAPFIAR